MKNTLINYTSLFALVCLGLWNSIQPAFASGQQSGIIDGTAVCVKHYVNSAAGSSARCFVSDRGDNIYHYELTVSKANDALRKALLAVGVDVDRVGALKCNVTSRMCEVAGASKTQLLSEFLSDHILQRFGF